MGMRADQAVNNHKSFYTCSASVLAAFADKIDVSEAEAKKIAAPFAGGRMGKCGAVMSAEYVLEQLYGEEAAAKIQEYEEAFKAEHKGSVMCADLRGNCRACVTDAASILEEMVD